MEAWFRLAELRPIRRGSSALVRSLQEASHGIARASGGVLGFGAISAAERSALERIGRVLAQPVAAPG